MNCTCTRYDKRTHDRLNKAAFDWCASFAENFSEFPEEDGHSELGSASGDMDAGADMDADEYHRCHGTQPVSQEEASPPQPRKRVGTGQPKKASKKKKWQSEAPAARNCSPTDGYDSEGAIELITAAEINIRDIQFAVIWEGYAHRACDWWQCLELGVAQSVLLDADLYAGKVVQLESSGRKMVQAIISEVGEEEWALAMADGTQASVAPHRCCMVGAEIPMMELCAWKLVPLSTAVYTDAIINWSSDALCSIQFACQDGDAYPTLEDAMVIVKGLHVQSAFTSNRDDHATLDTIIAFLTHPTREGVLMSRFACGDLKKRFLPEGLVYFAFKSLEGADEKDLSFLRLAATSKTNTHAKQGTVDSMIAAAARLVS